MVQGFPLYPRYCPLDPVLRVNKVYDFEENFFWVCVYASLSLSRPFSLISLSFSLFLSLSCPFLSLFLSLLFSPPHSVACRNARIAFVA